MLVPPVPLAVLAPGLARGGDVPDARLIIRGALRPVERYTERRGHPDRQRDVRAARLVLRPGVVIEVAVEILPRHDRGLDVVRLGERSVAGGGTGRPVNGIRGGHLDLPPVERPLVLAVVRRPKCAFVYDRARPVAGPVGGSGDIPPGCLRPIMEEIIKNIKAQIAAIEADIDKTGNKAVMARVRKATLALEKFGKEYRKVIVK